MTKIYFIIIIFYFSFLSEGDSQVTQEWLQYYDFDASVDVPVKMLTDGKGNIYVTGESFTSVIGGNKDIATVKYSSSGQELWSRRYAGNSSASDRPKGMLIDSAENIYVIGTTVNSFFRAAVIVIKYSPSGDEVWNRKFNFDINLTADNSSDAVLDNNGNICITGITYDTSFISYTFFVKYDLDGNKIMETKYTDNDVNIFLTYPQVIAVSSGGVTITFNNSKGSVVLLKYSSEGILEWDNSASGNMSSIITDTSGNFYVSGGNPYSQLIKFDTSGSFLWERKFPASDSSINSDFNAIGIDNNCNLCCLGWSYGYNLNRDILLIKYNIEGNEIWHRYYASFPFSEDEGYDLTFDNNDNIYVIGKSGSSMVTVKFDSAGIFKWERNIMNGLTSYYHAGIFVDESDNVISSGSVFQTGQNYNFATVKYSQVTGLQSESALSSPNFELYPNYPNPFNPSTTIKFSISKSDKVSLKVYDRLGRLISNLYNDFLNSGTYSISFNASGLTSGMYFYKLKTNEYESTRKMIFVK